MIARPFAGQRPANSNKTKNSFFLHDTPKFLTIEIVGVFFMLAFYAIVFIVLFGMHGVIGAWFSACVHTGWKLFAFWLPLLATVATVAGMWYSRLHYEGFAQIVYYISYIWFGFVFLGFCACLLFWAVRGIFYALSWPTGWLGIFSLLVLLAVYGVSLWGGFSEPQIKRISLTIPNMPKLKIALVSDTHLGMGVSLKRFDKALQKIEEEYPDVLFVLGDLFEYGPQREEYAARLKKVHTSLGSYGVFGNHEYYVGYEKSKDFFKNANVTLLENEALVLPNGVQLVGLKDIHTARVSAQEVTDLVAAQNPKKSVIVLSHTPKYAEEAAAAGADLMFSGHTHNGQLWPFSYLVRLQFPRVYGLFDVDNMKFYITSGMFYWGIPLRFLAPAEIPIIEVNL